MLFFQCKKQDSFFFMKIAQDISGKYFIAAGHLPIQMPFFK